MNFLYSIYFAIPNLSRYGNVGKVFDKLLAMIMKRILDIIVPRQLKKKKSNTNFNLNDQVRDEKYIVSLTSFPARINDIWITIETILNQTFKPDMIVLWLGKDKFDNFELPENLINLKSRGLKIEFVEDLRSHTKYFYAFKLDPSANIITLDDDEYYPKDVLENLVKLHEKYPHTICANRAHKITFFNKGFSQYRLWKHNHKGITIPSHLLMQTGVGGVLYPPNSLHPDVFNKNVFQEICLRADDIWLKMMAFRNGTKIVTGKNYNKDFITVSKTQKENLVMQNVFDGGNDMQLQSVCEYYSIDAAHMM